VFFRDELHRQSYEESINKKELGAAGAGREVQELGYLSSFMKNVLVDKDEAYKEIMQHMLKTYKLDSINIYYGEGMQLVHNVGQKLNYSDDAKYVHTDEFKGLLKGEPYMQSGFIGNLMEEAPEFCDLMKRRRVFSTVQSIIGTPENIMGLVTFDKCKESSQWAEYEIDCANILASFLSMQLRTEK
jgi:hypothetical protein